MKHFLKWWPVVVFCIGAVGFIVNSSIEFGELKSDTEHHHDSAKLERVDLKEEDVRIHKKIDRHGKKLSKLSAKTEKMQEGFIRLETNQTVIIDNQKNMDRILRRLEAR